MSRRRVTFSVCVNSFSGTFQVVSLLFTFSSRDNLPCSTRDRAPVAATGLLMDPAWNSVFVVTGVDEPGAMTP